MSGSLITNPKLQKRLSSVRLVWNLQKQQKIHSSLEGKTCER